MNRRSAQSIEPRNDRLRRFSSLFLGCLLSTLVSVSLCSESLAVQPSWRALLSACSEAGSSCPKLRNSFGERSLALDASPWGAKEASGFSYLSGIVRLAKAEVGAGLSWIDMPQNDAGPAQRLLRISAHWGLLYAPTSNAFVSSERVSQPFSKRHLFLDRVAQLTEREAARTEFGVDGQGVLIGVVDSGIDINHPDFLDREGKTRIAWYLVFGRAPAGIHAQLEDAYGCVLRNDCAIYSRVEIDQALATGLVGSIGPDRNGHGSHVASIAAGNDSSYPGVASGAELVIVKAGNSRDGLSDERILLGAQFIQARADDLNRPVVTNLSLGSSFGAHDGQSALELALEELIQEPGHLLCVAAGNQGSVSSDSKSSLPGPYGSHSEFDLPAAETRELPFFTAGDQVEGVGSIFLWLRSERERSLSIAFDDRKGHRSPFVESGADQMFESSSLGDTSGDYEVLILNRDDESLLEGIELDDRSAIVIVSGSFSQARTFSLQLKGQGTVDVWLESSGDFSSAASGAFLPRARSAGTLTIPATAPELIAVGSVTNRNSWPTLNDELVQYASGIVAERSDFSGAGPNAQGHLKPDIMAPGGSVVAAMSSVSDPRNSGAGSNFSGIGICSSAQPNCLVVDDLHGVSIGTSMSSPVVAGALALLLARQPELTQREALVLLQASAQPVGTQAEGFAVGAGQLDINELLRAQDRSLGDQGNEPKASHSRIVMADTYVRPGGEIEGLVLLRDADGSAAGPVELEQFRVVAPEFAQASLSVAAGDQAFGALSLRVLTDEQTALKSLKIDVYFRDELLASQELLIATEPQFVESGYQWGAGGCSIDSRSLGKNYRLQGSIMGLLLACSALTRCVRRRVYNKLS